MTEPLLSGLNPEQLQAVTWPAQSALVLAGAGSGKTRVLTTRIAWLLQTGQADVRSILAVTFTNKAAREMQHRLTSQIDAPLRAMWLGTFHGICHRFLRLHHRDARLPATFQILDQSDQLSAIKRLLKRNNVSEEIIAPRTLQGFVNSSKEAGLRAGALEPDTAHTQKLIEYFAAYDAQCQQEGVVDFAELMLRSHEMLSDFPALRAHYQSRFRHILVDEFQDTNRLQYAWLKLMAGPECAVFAVGDDDQSIYRFRGAEVGNMAQFLQDFRVPEPVKLEQNYRSDGHILAAANAVIANNPKRLGKNLRTDAQNGEKLRLYSAFNDIQEAQFVVEEVQALAREQGWPLDSMAVLYRGNAQSRVLEQALFQAAVPYRIYGGLRFYERQEVKHALAYLRLAVTPEDEQAFLRVVNFPPRGIGTRSIESLQAIAQQNHTSLWQAALDLSPKNAKVAAFVRLIQHLSAHVTQTRLEELMSLIARDSGLIEHYRNQKIDQQDRIDNLNELVSAAMGFNAVALQESADADAQTLMAQNETQEDAWPQEVRLPENAAPHPTFAATQIFLANAALEAGEHQADDSVPALQLMTVHAAKGLEFNAVFLTGVEEGVFPSEYSLAERDGLEEERRLMYVAITRARRRLYLSMAQQRMLHGQTHAGFWSRFVRELPESATHWLSGSLPGSIVNKQRQSERTNPMHKRSPHVLDAAAAQNLDGFRIGQNVRHPKFGLGVIIDGVSKGQSARLSINFGKEGIKELDTAFAKLTLA